MNKEQLLAEKARLVDEVHVLRRAIAAATDNMAEFQRQICIKKSQEGEARHALQKVRVELGELELMPCSICFSLRLQGDRRDICTHKRLYMEVDNE